MKVGCVAVVAVLTVIPFGATPSFAHVAAVRTPPPRDGAGFVFDSAIGRDVLFGGRFLHDTWTWDGAVWTKQDPAHRPPPRDEAAAAYDAARNEVVMFGGLTNRYHGATWTWDGTDWTMQHPAHSPAARFATAMAYDAARRRVVLFGGLAHFAAAQNDTWTWDGQDWTKLHPAHRPPRRQNFGMVYDAARREVVMFGGIDYGSPRIYSDTWTWDGADWTLEHPAHSPSERDSFGMAYDSANEQVVLFGGSAPGLTNETWTWDGTDWTQHQPARSPSARTRPQLASDGTHVVLFGGFEIKGALGDTWTWDGTDWSLGTMARVHASPRTGPPGTLVALRVTGLAGRERVRITFVEAGPTSTLLKKVTTDAEGTFTTNVRIPSGATLGSHYIRVRGIASGEAATRSFTVT